MSAGASGPAAPDAWLLERLACPATRTALRLDPAKAKLVSDAAGTAYRLRDGVPVLMVPENN